MSRRDGPSGRRAGRSARGQAMVEFALVCVIFILLVMGVLDFGRGIFMWNTVSEASREIARATSVHPGSPLGSSAETQAVVDSQRDLLGDMPDPTFTCVDIDGSTVSGACSPGYWVRVEVQASYTPVAPPLLFLVGNITLKSTSSIQIP